MADQHHAFAVAPCGFERRAQHPAHGRADTIAILEIAVRLVHEPPSVRRREPAAEKRPSVTGEMRPAQPAVRPRRELAQILCRRLRLLEQPLDAGQVDADVAMRAVEQVGPGDEHEGMRRASQATPRRAGRMRRKPASSTRTSCTR